MAEQGRPTRTVLVLGLGVVAGGLWWLLRGDAAVPKDAAAEVASQANAASQATGPRSRPELVIDPLKLALASVSGTIRDAQGQPITGAQVCARTRAERLVSSDMRKIHCATSGRDGAYRIEGLLGVRHGVYASAPTFIPGLYFRGVGVSRREFVELRAGQELREVDITLQGGGVEIHGVVKDLSGGAVEGAQVMGNNAFALTGAEGLFSMWVKPGSTWVTAQADGYANGNDDGAAPGHRFEIFLTPEAVLVGKVVRAADGTPVEGAHVTAGGGGWSWNEGAALTDAGGNFRLDGLEPGAYKAHAEADDVMGKAEEQAILGLGETSAPIVIQAHPAFFIEGKIVSAEGEACDSGYLYLTDHANSRDAQGYTEGDGVVRARGLLPGEFQVTIRCPGKISAERYERVTIVDKSVTGLRWEVTGGRVIRGTVIGAGGKGVEGISVRASVNPDPSKPRAQTTSVWSAQTDGEGRFELAGLLPGDYEVTLSAWNPPRAVPDKPTAVKLSADRDVEDLRIVLPASGELKGTVRDAQGRAVADVQVAMHDGKRWLNTVVADDGSFRFESVAPGDYRVRATRNWEAMRAPGTSDDDVQGEKVSIREGGVETVKLVVAGAAEKIAGVVRDESGGPVADAFIEATLESDSATAASGAAARDGRWASFYGTPHLSDEDGRFTLEDLSPGKHTLRAHRKGGGEAILEHVASGSDVVLTIAGTGRMAGTVALRGAGAPEDFTISLEDEKTGFRRHDSFFRTGGAWTLPELPAGTYKLKVGAGGGSAEVEATMTAGQDTTGLRIELVPKVTVRGTLVDLEGKPVPGLYVSVSDGGAAYGGGDEKKLNITDDAGRYEVTQAPAGKVIVYVYPQNWDGDDYEFTSMPVVIAASDAAVELPPIRVARKRVKKGDAAGDLGLGLKQVEPGADPLLFRCMVAMVRPGGPASAAGLVPGDEIVTVDGQAVSGANSYLYHALTRVVPGTVVTLGLARGASVQVTAGELP
ncbi:MAG: carboxypeptidase regulatory-like domain-containing protein [Nannocystis sp.]|nr:carboxypeptidase regulatory-like domain-containing protein [Nannocystis sp.]MBA3546822.1 carboxypeptidase regulatory-like domain-containing protein [Nannocystis sp.]